MAAEGIVGDDEGAALLGSIKHAAHAVEGGIKKGAQAVERGAHKVGGSLGWWVWGVCGLWEHGARRVVVGACMPALATVQFRMSSYTYTFVYIIGLDASIRWRTR